MKPALIDVPVALIFFNRPDTLEKVFDVIKEVKPNQLFLIQDGAREKRDDDVEKIFECRKIVENIDWDCEVYRDYSETNLGCGMRVYSGITNAFQKVDRLIILEDDILANRSFFSFCKELLEKYKDDERINMISGMNHLEQYSSNDESYFFSKNGSIWGWATWKRVWGKVDYNMEFAKDKKIMDLIYNVIPNKYVAKKLVQNGTEKREQLNSGENLTAWSYQFGMTMYLNSQLIIVPKYNLTSNIGITADSTHATDSLKKMPKSIQRVFFMKTIEMDFPLTHPNHVIDDVIFTQKIEKIMGSNKVSIFIRRVEGKLRRLLYR